jgi:hypothetical protein
MTPIPVTSVAASPSPFKSEWDFFLPPPCVKLHTAIKMSLYATLDINSCINLIIC